MNNVSEQHAGLFAHELNRREMALLMLGAVGAAAVGPLLLTGCGESAPQIPDQPGAPIVPHVAMERKEIHTETDILHGGTWQYLNGAEVLADGSLELSPTGLSIINKHGHNSIQPNPPLNLYGTRLHNSGDFAIKTHMQSDGPASVQFYSQAPIRLDDERIERGRVECTTSGNTVTIRVWDGSSPAPATVRSFPFSGSPTDRQLEFRREGDTLSVLINGDQVGSVTQGNLFNSGEVWLGFNSEYGQARVRKLTATPLNGHMLEVIDTTSMRIVQPVSQGLQTLVRRPGFLIGSAVSLEPSMFDTSYAELSYGHVIGSMTSENGLKPQDVHPLPEVYTFACGDALVNLAERNNLAFHGHTLVYAGSVSGDSPGASPQWVLELGGASASYVRQVLESHVYTVTSHFGDKVASWDVVNELLDGFSPGDIRLKDNVFYNALGEQYIDIALRAARDGAPNALLFLNDYGLETNPNTRGTAMLALAQRVLARGTPLDGIGIQGHVYEFPRDTIYTNNLKQVMNGCNSLGLKVRVSELDITGANGYSQQAAQYASVLQACLNAPNCIGLTMWGLTDAYGSTAGVAHNNLRPGNALPYTADYRPKLAVRAMQSALRSWRP